MHQPTLPDKKPAANMGEHGKLTTGIVLSRHDVITIPGTKRIPYLEGNIASEDVQLTPEDFAGIYAIMPAGIVSRTRYPEMFMNTFHR